MKTLDDWPRVKRVLEGALACEDGEREAFLALACAGDASLRAQVDTLLAARVRAGDFLETQAVLLLEDARRREDLSGRIVSSYRLRSRLGAGGMGDVYLARDTRLDRDVALKVLPEAFAADVEQLARFRREAQLLASLNHPNIGAIYGFEESGSIHALVLELVEGPTLADRIAQGALPLEEALPIARQIAEAVEAAHERGIVHRDLKPANIKLRPDGAVKVLDFGLAKALESRATATTMSSQSSKPSLPSTASPSSNVSQPSRTSLSSAPLAPHATGFGMLLGTPTYMSPEQARGKTAGKRADVWAFGCVLYEMLTGRRPFDGDTPAEVLAQILAREPDLGLLPSATPTPVRRLLRRCLEKESTRRLPDIGVARIEIDDALAGAPGSDADAQSALSSPRTRTWLAVAALAGALVGGGFIYSRLASPPEEAPVRASIALGQMLDLGVQQPAIAISPDGKRIVYRTSEQGPLLSRMLTDTASTAIPGTEGGLIPVFSPDGRWLAFFVRHALKKVSLDGGTVVTIATLPKNVGTQEFRGASWGDNGTIAFTSSTRGGLFGVSDQGGEARALTTLDRNAGEAAHRWPHLLPGGNAVLYTVKSTNLQTFDDAQIVARSLVTGEQRAVAQGALAQYLPTGHLVVARAGALYAVRFDPTRLAVSGRPVKVADGLVTHPESGGAQVAISRTGTLVYAPGSSHAAERPLLSVNRDGTARPIVARAAPFFRPRFSPDGRQVAMVIDAPFSKIWVLDVERGTLSRASQLAGDQDRPTWMPDGVHMTFAGDPEHGGTVRPFSDRIDGTESAKLLFDSEQSLAPMSWSADGKHLLYGQVGAATGQDVWVFAAEGRGSTPFLQGAANESAARFSPDGLWVAYMSDESGRPEVYVRPFPGPGTRSQVSIEGGAAPVWSRDGREVFFAKGGELFAAPVTLGHRFASGSVQRLLSGPYAFDEFDEMHANYDVAPDGRHFVVPRSRGDTSPRHLELVLNWFEDLERLAP